MSKNEQRDRARLEIAFNGLGRLALAERTLLLKDMFGVLEKSNTAEFREATDPQARKWQRKILDQLIKDGVVESSIDNDQQVYRAVDKSRLSSILDDYFKEDGALLSELVFPNRKTAAIKKIDEILLRHPEDPEEAERLVDRALDEGRLQKIPIPQSALDAAAADEDIDSNDEVLGAILDGVDALTESFNGLVDGTAENHQHFTGTLAALTESAASIEAKIEQKERAVGKRIEQFELRLIALQTVVEAIQRTLKTALSSIEELNKNARSTTELVGTLSNVQSLVEALNNNVLYSIHQNNAERKDQMGQLLRRLDVQLEENSELRNLFLEQLSDEGYERTERAAIQTLDKQNGKQK